LVLVEAQLMGLPVVAPVSGGSQNAFAEGFTGLRPSNESASALAGTLERILADEILYTRLSHNAFEWAMHDSSSDNLRAALGRLLGHPSK
jgi:glycosyltransferase involved in cell wall biosynthesis